MQGADFGGSALAQLFSVKALVFYAVCIVLGLWKLIDIAIWIFDHVSVDFG